MILLTLFLVVTNVLSGVLLLRAGRRLLQFDDIFQGILPTLDEYSSDLSRMSSADLDGILVDHPEVLAFHRRNLRARNAIAVIMGSVQQLVPPKPEKRETNLPRPDME